MITVLIVEDEAIVAADLAGKLRQLGYEVAGIAAEGEEAVALATGLRPDLVLMDIRLEGSIDGIEAAAAIRRQRDVPVVYLTAHSDAATLARAKLTGAFGYILKPFEERDLAAQIELALYKHQADWQLREQREWLRVTLTSIGDAVIATDAAGRITFMNPVAELLTGWKAEEATGQLLPSVFRIVNEQTGAPLEEPVTRVLREGRIVALANHAALVTKDGRTVPIEDSAAPILDAAGQVIGAVLVFHDVTEKRRAEEELRESREDLNRAQAVGQIGSWRLNVQRNELLWSEENHRIFGIPRGTPMTYETFLGTIHPEDREYVHEKWSAALQGEPYDIEHRIVIEDTVKWVRERAELEFDGNRLLLGGFGTTQDVTERKRAEHALRESESRLRLLSNTAARLLAADDPMGIVNELAGEVMDHLDCQAFFNFVADERAGKLHLNACAGIPDEEAQKIKWLDYGVAVCGCAARDGIRIVAENICKVLDPRTDLVKSYGIQAYACHPLMAGDRVLGTLSFGTTTRSHFSPSDLDLMKTVADQVAIAMERIRLMAELEHSRDELEMRVTSRTAELAEANTELKEIERALRSSKERLRRNNELLQKLFDGITDPLIMLDCDGLVTMVNKASMDYYGLGEGAEVFGKPCFQGLRGRDTVCPECEHPFLSVENETMTFERKGMSDPGRVEIVTVYPVLDEHGRRDAIVVRINDITQARILERQILQNEKLASLGLVTSGIAHEINNPNSFIYFNIPILKKYLEELMPILDEYAALHPEFEVLHMSFGELREDIFKLLENMEHGSQRINKIVGVLKSFVRKGDTRELQKTDLKELIEKVVALCQTELRHKVGSFEVLVPEGLPPLVSDPEALEQVILNLLINAIHACDKPDCHVSLKVEKSIPGGEGFIIEITDNGSGIEERVRERIFDPFFTTKSSTMGTGLGLYICHNHVTSLGGRIEVESRVGQGTTFRVVLPQTGEKQLDKAQPSPTG